jgi:4-amino-4-deoxychorismate lyase
MAADLRLFSSLRYDPILIQVPEKNVKHAGWNLDHASPLYMLDLHRDRMLRAATHWSWDAAVQALSGDSGLEKIKDFLLRAMGPNQTTALRVKITVSANGDLGCEFSPTPRTLLVNLFPSQLPPPGQAAESFSQEWPRKIPEYEVMLDSVQTNRSEYTHFKTTKRAMYDAARERARLNLADKKEILLISSSDGCIMEGTMTTPYFWRHGRWVTPTVSPQFSTTNGNGGQDGTTRRWMLER